jgi:broad specificity phosphatase PhoE
MKTIEIRRHSIRERMSPDLSEEGRVLARFIGEELGPFDRVITSQLPRAFQTAVAMGFQVNEQLELLNTYGDFVEAEIPWPASFDEYAAPLLRNGAPKRYAQRLLEYYTHLAESLADGGAALVITHGGVVEIGAVVCLPNADHAAWGSYVECCEGVRLFWDDDKFINVEIVRV